MPRDTYSSEISLAVAQDIKFLKALKRFRALPLPGTRDLHVLRNVAPSGTVAGSFDSKLAEITEVLRAARCFYRFDDEIVAERGEGEAGMLVTLASSDTVSPAAWAYLANYMICEVGGSDDDEPARQFPLPSKLVETLLHRTATRSALPAITGYYRRPILDESFRLRQVGYHEDIQALVHCFDLEVPAVGTSPRSSAPIRDRLPRHLLALLRDFCWRDDADLANAVALLLTGLLANLLVENGKPVFVLDGNQPGLG